MHTLETKYKAIVHYDHFLRSLRQVSKIYNVGKSTLQRWLKERGVALKKPRTKQLRSDVVACVEKSISDNPFCSLKELASKIASVCSLKRSPSSVSRLLKACKLSYKNARRFVDYDHNNASVSVFANTFLKEKDNIVCVDELGFYVGDTPRKGWSRMGTRLRTPTQRCLRQKKYSVIVAISITGVVKYSVLESNCKKADFAKFCSELNVPEGTHLLMDNVAFHKSKEVQAVLAEQKIIPMFIPPYSPRTNPIENLFGVIKPKYRKMCPIVPNNVFDYKALFSNILDDHRLENLTEFYDHAASFLRETLQMIASDPEFRFVGYG